MWTSLLLGLLLVSGAWANCCDTASLCITAPQTMEALSGSCLQIPCNFSSPSKPNFAGKYVGVWIKSDSRFKDFPENVIFNGSRNNNYPVKIIGDLRQKSCTSIFESLNGTYNDKFFFRVEEKKKGVEVKPFQATASCQPVKITILDRPPKPRINMSGDLKEGAWLTLTCSALTPCPHSPPTLTWHHEEHTLNQVQLRADGNLITIERNISLSDKHHGSNITCFASYPVRGEHVKILHQVTLNISYTPKDTVAFIGPSVLADGQVNLTCTSRANPPVHQYTWFKADPGGATKVSEGAVHRVNATDRGVYFCEVTNAVGSQTSPELHLNAQNFGWGPLLGGLAGIVCLVCCVICVWCFRSAHPTAQQTQSKTGDELVMEENLHYGQIDFSRQQAGPSSETLRDGMQPQDVVYAQVKVSKAENTPDDQ